MFSINLFPPKYFRRRSYSQSLVWCALISLCSCNKFIEVDPPITSQEGSTVYNNEASATASIGNAYSKIVSLSPLITQFAGFTADELLDESGNSDNRSFAANNILATNSANASFWSQVYNVIYIANSAVEGLSVSKGVAESVRKQLIGEALFIRALMNFYLANFYGDVPLVLTTDFTANKIAARASVADLYKQIISDLKDAKADMGPDYLGLDNLAGTERVRATSAVASALLARVYLYQKDWVNAISEATLVIDNPVYSLESDLNAVFLKNSNEAIFQVMPYEDFNDTYEAQNFLPYSDQTPPLIVLRPSMLDAFEPADQRLVNWTGRQIIESDTFYYANKYKVSFKNLGDPHAEYPMVLRLAEMFLIRAEGYAGQNQISEGLGDLNIIRNRAGLPDAQAATAAALQTAIMRERRAELFTEWGHRWLDLKRTGAIDAVLQTLKGADWQPTDSLYPLPQKEILNDPNLTQNPGY